MLLNIPQGKTKQNKTQTKTFHNPQDNPLQKRTTQSKLPFMPWLRNPELDYRISLIQNRLQQKFKIKILKAKFYQQQRNIQRLATNSEQ